MKKTKILGTALIGALLFSGCVQTAYTDGKASQVKKGDALTLGLD
ncbi:penicillin-binding protein activator LpoB, partial [Campylobacter jejuni]|nr:penicillin-binding protein activator LpoB [Campylobacter jejuni]